MVDAAAHDLGALVRHAWEVKSPIAERLLEAFLRYDGAGSLGVAKAQAILGSYFVMTDRAVAAAQVKERLRLLESPRLERLSAELMAVRREKYWEVNERRMNMEYVPDVQRERLREFLGRCARTLRARGRADRGWATTITPRIVRQARHARPHRRALDSTS